MHLNMRNLDIFKCYLTAALAELPGDEEEEVEEESSTPCRRHSLGLCLSLVLGTRSVLVSLATNVDRLHAIMDSVYTLHNPVREQKHSCGFSQSQGIFVIVGCMITTDLRRQRIQQCETGIYGFT